MIKLVSYEQFHNLSWDLRDRMITGSVWDERADAPVGGARIDLIRACVRDGFKDTTVLASEYTEPSGYFEFSDELGLYDLERDYLQLGSSVDVYYYLKVGGTTSSRLNLEEQLANAGIIILPTETLVGPKTVTVQDTGGETTQGQPLGQPSYGGQCPSGYVWDPVYRECVPVDLGDDVIDHFPDEGNPGHDTRSDRDVTTLNNLPLVIIGVLILSIAMFLRR